MNHGTPTSVARSRLLAVGLAAVVLGACGGNHYEPPPPPEVTVSAARRARGHDLQRVHRPHRGGRGRRHPRARAGLSCRASTSSPAATSRRATCSSSSSPTLYQARVRSGARRTLAGKRGPDRAAQEQLAITEAIFERNGRQPTDLVQKTQARDSRKAQVAMAQADLARRQARSLLHAHLRADRRAHRPQLRRRRQSRRRRRGDAARLDRPRRSDLRLLHGERARAPAVPRAAAAAARTVAPEGQRQRGLPSVLLGRPRRASRTPGKSTTSATASIRRPARSRCAPSSRTRTTCILARALRARARAASRASRRCSSPTSRCGATRAAATSCSSTHENVVQYRRVDVGPRRRTATAGRSRTGSTPADWVVVERPAARAAGQRREAAAHRDDGAAARRRRPTPPRRRAPPA